MTRKSLETFLKTVKERYSKDNQVAQVTLKGFIDHFQQGLDDPACMLISIKKYIHFEGRAQN